MKKTITITTALGVLAASVPVYATPVENVKPSVNLESIAEKTDSKQIYLSDIEYVKNQSNTGWKSIMKDANTDGMPIKLIVDGETVEFEKGMGAHAPSTLVYDLSQYTDEYTRLVTYMGLDANQGTKGDGVKFTVSTSEDGVTWTEVKTIEVLKGNSESVYLDLKLDGAKFVKLYANENGGKGNDHAVYGDLKLVKDDYTLSTTPILGLQTVESYDAILSNNTVEKNMESNQMTILQRAFVNRVGYESLQRIAGKSESYAKAINYLMNNETALNYFITGGPVNKNGSYQASVRHFCEIYSKYEDQLKETADNNFNLRLAISIALGYSNSEMTGFWIISNKDKTAVTRYETYQKLVASGVMDESGNTNDHRKWSTQEFKDLPIPLMRWVVDARFNDDEAEWLAEYALSEKAKGKKPCRCLQLHHLHYGIQLY